MAGVLMIAVQALEERTAVLQQEKERLKEAVEASKAENAELRARLEAVEKRTFAKEALAQKEIPLRELEFDGVSEGRLLFRASANESLDFSGLWAENLATAERHDRRQWTRALEKAS